MNVKHKAGVFSRLVAFNKGLASREFLDRKSRIFKDHSRRGSCEIVVIYDENNGTIDSARFSIV